MSKVSPIQALRSIRAWRSFGTSNGYGRISFGFTYFGEDNEFAGIYRRRPHRRGVSLVKMDFYAPVYRRTDAQAVQRDKFADAHAAWTALSESEKEVLRRLAARRSKRGYNVFLTKYLKTH